MREPKQNTEWTPKKALRRSLKQSPKVSDDIDHQFLFWLCETYTVLPSDPFIENMNPVERFWLFMGWAKKRSIDVENLRSHGILIGSFTDPKRAQQMLKKPDYELSDEEFESSWDVVQNQKEEAREEALNDINNRRRRRRKMVTNGK